MSDKPKFTHLHVHSHYSLLQALPKIEDLVAAAKERGMTALALTDYGAMYGAIEFYKECKKQGIRPIMGLCAYVAIDKMTDKRPRIDDRTHQMVLLAETFEGYQNLLRISTASYLEGFYYKPRIDKDLLRRYGKGLIGLVGGTKSDISNRLSMDDHEGAEVLAREYQDILGAGNFFLELQDHAESDDHLARNADLLTLSKKTGIPVVATKDVHYVHPEDAEAQDLLVCIGAGKTIYQDDRGRMTGIDYSFASADQMAAAFAHAPEAIANTMAIAERCNVEVPIAKWHFAHYEIPAGKTHDDVLREQTYAGLAEKVPEITEEMRQRLEYELDIIKTKGYAAYFLVVSDYMTFARKQAIMTTTRGSAAGSLVSYAIDIVPVNPLDYKLPFERFLNPFRPSAPDIDGDFADDRRDEMIAYVTEKYGKDKVAQIGTFGTMAARGAVRDVGRALGLPYALCDRVAKLIPMGSQGFAMTIDRAVKETPELRDLIETDPQVKRAIELARKVEGCARHVSVHAAGVVISPEPLTEYTALQREPGGERIITQFDMNAVGEDGAGVLKMDFLGIRNLSIIGNAIKIIRKTKGDEIDILKIPRDDKKAFELLARGETIGLFQLSGDGMTKYLVDLKPSNIFDIMAMVALYRPGPIESIPEFIRRKHDPSLVTYLDPRLKDILSMSYGVITYQDDVLLTAINLAGYDWEKADKLRKAMGKKIPEVMAAEKDKLIKGFLAHGKEFGMTPHKAEQLWKLIEPFAAYGFNKSHASSYATVAYQTAYLKANWPAEFMAAVLTAESGDLDTIAEVVAECTKMGIVVLPPDVNSSEADFTYIDDQQIRFGLNAIKNLGSDTVKDIVAEREKNGAFVSIADLASRVSAKAFNKKSLEAMAKSGALDALGERNYILSGLDQILSFHKNAVKDSDSGQSNMFLGSPMVGAAQPELVLRDVPPATKREKLAWERELLGLYVSEHPFKEYAEYFGELLTPTNRIGEKKGVPGLIRIGGIVMDMRQIFTKKKNEPMGFAKVEDMSGSVEVVVFPSAYKICGTVFAKDTVLMVEGKYDEKDGERKLLCEKAERITPENLESLKQKLSFFAERSAPSAARPVSSAKMVIEKEEVCIAVPAAMPLSLANEMKRIFGEHPGGRRVVLLVGNGAGRKKIETSFSIALTSDVISAVEKLVGRGAVVVERTG